jgi:beta-xylosidase
MGRQTLLQPVEWTADGWYKVPDNIKTEDPIKKPALPVTGTVFMLNDTFKGKTLQPQWSFFGEYDSKRVNATENGLTIKGKGNSVANCAPLTVVPSAPSYIAEVEMDIEGDATGGLVLFYDNRFYSGILADKENIIANLRGWQFATEKGINKRHVYLRLKNINNNVDMFYSTDGSTWKKIENSLEVSGYNHNVLSGFLSLRIGLCSMGEGSVQFKNFKFTPAE